MPVFASPPNQQAYYEQIWNLVHQIPFGKVATYGQLAKMLPPPHGVEIETYAAFAPRWVGGAMAACPDDVPWQRVINSQGKISERAGSEKQRQLLEAEGIIFDAKDRIDLKNYSWNGKKENIEPRHPTLF